MTSKLVSGGNIKGNASAAIYGVTTPPVKLSTYRAPFYIRNRLAVTIIGAVVTLTAFIVLFTINAQIGTHLSKTKVLESTADTLRMQAVYDGQSTEGLRVVLGLLIFLFAALFIFALAWLVIPYFDDSEGAVIVAPIIAGIIIVVLSTIGVISAAPGTTNTGAMYAAGSNWLELKHNIPYDVNNYFDNLSSDDGAGTNFAHNVKVTDENGTAHTLTISVGGADQSILTLHLKGE